MSGSVGDVPACRRLQAIGGGVARGESRAGRADRRSLKPRRLSRRPRGAGGPGGKAGRREMAPQRLERVQFAPGSGMAPTASDPQYLVQAPAAGVAPKNYRLSRRMAEATSTARGARVSVGPPQVAQSCKVV